MFPTNVILVAFILPLICANEWTHSSWLDHHQKYHLKWKTNDETETVSFLVEVQTKGWVGFGISPNGGMKNSDIVIGWITDDGKTYFHDRYASDESLPTIDESQDWKLLESAQNQTHTILQFSRPYKTCDNLHDLEITSDTTRLIYAFGDNDPESINKIKIHKHSQRGTKSALLVDHEKLEDPKEDDLEYYDFTVKNVTIPNKATSYWCKLFKVQLPVKRHVIKYLPEITPGNEAFTHHFVLFACGHPESYKLDKYLTSEGIDCTDSANMPPDLVHCLKPYFVWAVGGQPFIVPPEAGFPLGADDETTYFLLQTHYDNPDMVENEHDSSGLRAYHTSKLRPNEAFTIGMGSVVDYGMIIPPKQPNFQVAGHCDMQCFKQFMPRDGIKVFATLPHAHYIGTEIRTRHFRGNEELPWIVNDQNYDFNFQQFRLLRKTVNIMPEDMVTTECTYNSNLREFATLGGESTRAEMCLSFLSYYPRMKNNSQICMSGLTESSIMTVSGVKELKGFEPNHDPIIILPVELKNQSLSKYLTDKRDWDNNYQNLIKYGKQRQACYWIKAENNFDLDYLVSYPQNLKEYKLTENKCQKMSSHKAEAVHNNQIKFKINALLIFMSILSIVFIL